MANEIIKITPQGLDQIRERAAREIARGSNMRPLMTEVSGIMADAVEENFAQEGRPKWQDLAPPTKKARARRGKWPGQILQDSGQLAASVQPFATDTTAGVGTNKKYGPAQQFGKDIQRKPHGTTTRLRTDAKGELLRQDGHPNLSIFASKRHKRVRESFRLNMGFTIKIPARPFLSLTASDISKIEAAGKRHYDKS